MIPNVGFRSSKEKIYYFFNFYNMLIINILIEGDESFWHLFTLMGNTSGNAKVWEIMKMRWGECE